MLRFWLSCNKTKRYYKHKKLSMTEHTGAQALYSGPADIIEVFKLASHIFTSRIASLNSQMTCKTLDYRLGVTIDQWKNMHEHWADFLYMWLEETHCAISIPLILSETVKRMRLFSRPKTGSWWIAATFVIPDQSNMTCKEIYSAFQKQYASLANKTCNENFLSVHKILKALEITCDDMPLISWCMANLYIIE